MGEDDSKLGLGSRLGGLGGWNWLELAGTGSISLPLTDFVKVESKIFLVWRNRIIAPCFLKHDTRLR